MTAEPVKSAICHNSRLLSDRSPQGAVVCGSKVQLRLYAPRDVYAILRIKSEGEERLIEGQHDGEGAYEFTAQMPAEPGLVYYSFAINDRHSLMYYGAESGEGRLYNSDAPWYRITVYYEAFSVPAWFGRGVAYQIFPDRFFSSGGAFERAKYHLRMGRNIKLHQNWHEPVEYQPGPGEADYAPADFFGGDIEGMIQKLPYLKALGITCIYLNPIFESRSNHRYDTADYFRLDPMLGLPCDFKRLCEAAAEFGIRIVLDGVFSHTGADSVYFNKYGAYPSIGACQSKQSRYYGWYTFYEWPNSYKSWWGFKSLPEVDETNADYGEFICGESGVIKHWMDQGAAGWRLDVADELPDHFIKRIRQRVKAERKDAVLIGEVWEDASTKVSMGQRRGYVDGDEFDSVMNYPLRAALIDFFTGRLDAYGLYEFLSTQRENYPKPFYYSLLNILGSHDTERIISALSGAELSECCTRAQQEQHALSASEYELGKRRLLACSLLLYTLPGVPCIYYGDEAGLTGLLDPFNRGTYPWGRQDAELLEHFKLLGKLRQTLDCISRGLCVLCAPDRDVLSAVRYINKSQDAFLEPAQNGCVIAAVNRSQSAKSVRVDPVLYSEGPDAPYLQLDGEYVDALTGKQYAWSGETMDIMLEPLSACLLVKQNADTKAAD